QQVRQRVDEVAANAATDAAALQDQRVLDRGLAKQVVERDFAELIDDDGSVRHLRTGQQMIEQRGLAAAEKAGDDRDRHFPAVRVTAHVQKVVSRTSSPPPKRSTA